MLTCDLEAKAGIVHLSMKIMTSVLVDPIMQYANFAASHITIALFKSEIIDQSRFFFAYFEIRNR
jgi:hypothetical protein